MACSSRSPPLSQDFFQLPSQHTFNGDNFDLFSNAFLFEETIEG
jgi:hypothetical protein